MIVLGLESSAGVAGVAAIKDGVLLSEYSVNTKKTHSQTLMPMLEEITMAVGINENFSEVSGIAVSKGPGSFTGLRIGSACAKGLAYVMNCPVLGIPTLDAMAFQLYGINGIVCPIMDARRNQVYTGIYSFDEKENDKLPKSVRIDEYTVMNTVFESRPMDIKELSEVLNGLGKMVTFTGDGCPVYEEELRKNLTVPVRFAPSFSARQRAASVAALGEIYLKNGLVETASGHKPEYMRQSQAERVRDEKKQEVFDAGK